MPKQPKPVKALKKHERLYNKRMRDLYLNPLFRELSDRLATATAAQQAYYNLDAVVAEWVAKPRSGVPTEAIQEMLDEMRNYNRARLISSFRAALGINVGPLLTEGMVGVFMRAKVDENVGLIKTIPERMHASLAARIAGTLETAPFDQNMLMKLLREEYKSSGWNLRRITRDQTNKMNGSLNRVRQEQLSVEGYRWLSAADGRVRSNHVALDGDYFRWDTPPVGGGTTSGEAGHPGSGVLCRCVAQAAISEDDQRRLIEATGGRR